MKIILIVVAVVLLILLVVIIIFLKKKFSKKPKIKTTVDNNIIKTEEFYAIDSKNNLNEKPKKRSIKNNKVRLEPIKPRNYRIIKNKPDDDIKPGNPTLPNVRSIKNKTVNVYDIKNN